MGRCLIGREIILTISTHIGRAMVREETYASIRVIGSSVLPNEITESLNLVPTRTWRKGERFIDVTGKLRKRYNGLWLYDVKGIEFKSPVEHVKYLMNIVKGRTVCCKRDLQIDLCLWISAMEKFWMLGGQDIDQMIEWGFDGLNISFVGLGDDLVKDTRNSREKTAMARIRLFELEYIRIVCSVMEEGKSAECIGNVLSMFVNRLNEKKVEEKPSSYSILVEWTVSHGALYIKSEDLKLFRSIGCTQFEFAFRNT